MDIIQRALRVVDKLIVGVALDTGKAPIFDIEMRSKLVNEDLKLLGADAARVEAHGFSGLLVNFAREHKASLLIRGLRAVSDYEYEFQMACLNARLAPEMETIFLTADESMHYISSRFIKQIARLGGDVSDFVSPNVTRALKEKYKTA